MRLVDIAGRTLATNKLVKPGIAHAYFNYNESLSSGVFLYKWLLKENNTASSWVKQ